MRGNRCSFTAAGQREFYKNCVNNSAGDFAKSISVEEEKWSGTVTLQKKVQRFAERQGLGVDGFPALPDSLKSFGVISELSFSSFARSSIEAGDKLPVPVFDKSGSAL